MFVYIHLGFDYYGFDGGVICNSVFVGFCKGNFV